MEKIRTQRNLLLQILPLFLVLVIFLFTTSELYVFLGVAFLIVLTFVIQYNKGEWKLLLLGIVLGLLFELGGDLVYRAQYWENASFFGIPVWLPLMWGYGFVCIRRIGNALVN